MILHGYWINRIYRELLLSPGCMFHALKGSSMIESSQQRLTKSLTSFLLVGYGTEKQFTSPPHPHHLAVQCCCGQQYGTSHSFPQTIRPILHMLWPPLDPATTAVRLGGRNFCPTIMDTERNQGPCW